MKSIKANVFIGNGSKGCLASGNTTIYGVPARRMMIPIMLRQDFGDVRLGSLAYIDAVRGRVRQTADR